MQDVISYIPCQQPNCFQSNGKPRKANSLCQRGVPTCRHCCVVLGGCGLNSHQMGYNIKVDIPSAYVVCFSYPNFLLPSYY